MGSPLSIGFSGTMAEKLSFHHREYIFNFINEKYRFDKK
jgi:hypothetical protein